MSDPIAVPLKLRDGRDGHAGVLRAGHGAPLVLIHGVGMAARIWQPQIEALSASFDVIAIDMLGHGGSSLPPIDARLSDYSDQVLAVLDALSIARAHVVGHSMGALVALDFALAHPARTLSIAALNAVYCRSPAHRAAVEARAAAMEDPEDNQSLTAPLARWFGDPIPASLQAAANAARDCLLAVDRDGYARTYRLFATSDDAHRERLPHLAVPALFLTAEHDPNSTPAMSIAMAAAAPRGEADVIAGERHMMGLTAPDAVNRRLLAFLAAVGGPLAAPIDPKAFRRALGSFLTGVTVVATVQADGEPRGFTANSFTSVSLDPPLVLVCIAKTAASHDVFAAAPQFSISVLAETQRDISGLFASKAPDKFDRAAWRREVTGSPIIEGAIGWFDCRRHKLVDAGDHVILIGEVVAFGDGAGSPLGYCRGAYLNLGSSSEALAAASQRKRVGAILQHGETILMIEAPDGSLDLPTGHSLGAAGDPASLNGALLRLGIVGEIGFLFAVFEEHRADVVTLCVYYRGTVLGELPAAPTLRAIPLDALPASRIKDDAVRVMLERYARERSEDVFGIYVGDSSSGTVRALAR